MKDITHNFSSLQVFERAAELFGLLSAPVRLRIVSALCTGEKNVSELRTLIHAAQPNISQHLTMLYRSGVVAKRRNGAQIFYRIDDEFSGLVCRAVCSQVAAEVRNTNGLSIR
jgi:DNA-binding transcriptional ArsR family regulator